jgi:hypothetical protein
VADTREQPEDRDETDAAPASEALSGQIVPRRDGAPARSRLTRGVESLRDRLPEIARNPAVVAAATVGTGLAINAVRQAARAGVLVPGNRQTAVTVTGYVVHHVHVVHHHVVHHVVTQRWVEPPR